MEKAGFEDKTANPPHYNNGPPYPADPPGYTQQAQVPYTPAGGPPINVQPGTTTIIVSQPALGEMPCRLRCPHCQADVSTSVHYETGMMTHICAGIICLLCFPLACLPYCTDCTKDTVHECPNCKNYIGLGRR